VPRLAGGDGDDRFVFDGAAIRAFDVVDIQDFDQDGDDVIGIDVFGEPVGAAALTGAFNGGVRIHTAEFGVATVTTAGTPLTPDLVFGTFPDASSFADAFAGGLTMFTSGLVFALADDGDALWLGEVTVSQGLADVFTVATATSRAIDAADDIILV
jgi:hypothetical protein